MDTLKFDAFNIRGNGATGCLDDECRHKCKSFGGDGERSENVNPRGVEPRPTNEAADFQRNHIIPEIADNLVRQFLREKDLSRSFEGERHGRGAIDDTPITGVFESGKRNGSAQALLWVHEKPHHRMEESRGCFLAMDFSFAFYVEGSDRGRESSMTPLLWEQIELGF